MTTQVQVEGLGDFAHRGFTLEYDGATVVLLLHEGEPVARFSQAGATEEGIQAECAKHLVIKHRWEGRIWP
ncbi:unnamed protein product [marine sediment metagenome]|uniref:Uncharacterized protein n=1 Tax=marine sediment metagenome TaxID=412755 RepID=X1QKF5_9ZZZZ